MGQESEEPVKLGRQIYDLAKLPVEGKRLVVELRFVQIRIQELTNQHALLTKARNAYIADLKSEIVQGRSGINLEELFSDD